MSSIEMLIGPLKKKKDKQKTGKRNLEPPKNV